MIWLFAAVFALCVLGLCLLDPDLRGRRADTSTFTIDGGFRPRHEPAWGFHTVQLSASDRVDLPNALNMPLFQHKTLTISRDEILVGDQSIKIADVESVTVVPVRSNFGQSIGGGAFFLFVAWAGFSLGGPVSILIGVLAIFGVWISISRFSTSLARYDDEERQEAWKALGGLGFSVLMASFAIGSWTAFSILGFVMLGLMIFAGLLALGGIAILRDLASGRKAILVTTRTGTYEIFAGKDPDVIEKIRQTIDDGVGRSRSVAAHTSS